MFLILTLIIALAGLLSSIDASSPHMYRCSFCMTSAASAAASAKTAATSFQESCVSAFSKDACEQTFGGSELFQKIPAVASAADAGEFCFQHQYCPNPAVWKATTATSTTSSMDIRVTKAMGGKGYNKVSKHKLFFVKVVCGLKHKRITINKSIMFQLLHVLTYIYI